MQSAKDSFYVALRDRLAALNPQRTVFLNGVTRPAVIVVENEYITAAGPLPEAFYLDWESAQPVVSMRNGPGSPERLGLAFWGGSGPPPLLSLECTISYWTGGSADQQGVDRGRVLAQLDSELLAICSPPSTVKYDCSQTPPVDLGTKVLWTLPELRLKTQAQLQGAAPLWTVMGDQLIGSPSDSVPVIRLERAASLTIFFYPEAGS
jgi:hypothetical protein